MSAVILEYSARRPIRISEVTPETRTFAILVGIVPVFLFLVAVGGNAHDWPITLQPQWQSGKPTDIIALLMSWRAGYFFWPFLAWATLSLILVLWSPTRAARWLFVRIGIACGIVMSLHFAVLTAMYMGYETHESIVPFFMVFFGSAALVVFWWLPRDLHSGIRCLARMGSAALILPATTWPCMLLMHLGHPRGVTVIYQLAQVIYLAIWLWPFWMLATYVSLAGLLHLKLTPPKGPRWNHVLTWFAWPLTASAYSFAWWEAWQAAWEQYSWLPKEQPGGCYVVTAAARGHSWLVGAEWRYDAQGRAWVSSRQLRVLKCAEMILALVLPRTHRICRWLYDRIGPRMAACLRNPWLADAAYLALKPVEWSIRFACRAAGVRTEKTRI